MIRQIRIALLSILMLLCYIKSNSQEPLSISITTRNGLMSNEIYDIFQDRKGFIWLATGRGISRFDGINVKNFSVQEYSSEGVSNIFEDQVGRIWFHSFWGQWFYVANDSLHHFHTFNFQLINPDYDEVNQTASFAAPGGIVEINLNKLTHHPVINSSIQKGLKDNTNYLSALCSDGKGGYYLYNYEKKLFFLDSNKNLSSIPFEQNENNIHLFKFNNLPYIFNSVGVYALESKDAVAFRKKIPVLANAKIASVRQISKNELLICTYNQGAYLLDGNFNPISENKEGIFKSLSLSNGLKDKEGNYWFGSLKQGAKFVSDLNLKRLTDAKESILTAIHKLSNESLLLGYADGRITNYSLQTGSENLVTKLNAAIKAFKLDLQGKTYVVADKIYWLSNEANFTFAVFEGTADAKDLDFLWGNIPIINTSNVCLALLSTCTDEQLGQFEKTWDALIREQSQQHPNILKKYFPITSKRAFGLAIGNVGNSIYTSATDGLYRIQPDKKTIITYKGNNIFSKCLLYTDGILFCATNRGLLLIKGDNVVKSFDMQNGLRDEQIQKIKQNGNHLYLLSMHGVDRLDLHSDRVEHLQNLNIDGEQEITDLLVVDKQIYLATTGGLVRIPLNSFTTHSLKPLLYLSGIETRDGKTLPSLTSLTFNSENSSLKFLFTGLHYRSGSALRYAYKLIGGKDTNWISRLGAEPYMEFSNLASGTYTFKLKAITTSGYESEVISQKFQILPPFYKTIWFWLFLTLLAMALVGYFYRNRIRKKNIQAIEQLSKVKIEKELQQSQLTALKAQMNPHFMFNALNSIQDFILTNEKRLANQYLGKFSDLMRLTLDMSQDEKVLLADEIKSLKLYLELEKLRFGDDLKFDIQIEPEINPEQVAIPSMLIQPYIENALKHGLLHRKGNKLISIKFSRKNNEDVLVVTVEDNGIGRTRSEEIKQFRNQTHRSFGSSATKQRLELLNSGRKNSISVIYQDNLDSKNEPSGTKVSIEIPIDN